MPRRRGGVLALNASSGRAFHVRVPVASSSARRSLRYSIDGSAFVIAPSCKRPTRRIGAGRFLFGAWVVLLRALLLGRAGAEPASGRIAVERMRVLGCAGL